MDRWCATAQLDAWDDEEVPFHRLTAELAPERQLTRNPLIDVSFQVRSAYFAPRFPARPRSRRRLAAHGGKSKFDMEVAVVQRAGGATTEVEYDTELYDAATVEAFFAGWQAFFAAALAAPAASLAALAAAPEPVATAAAKAPSEAEIGRRLHALWGELLALSEIDPDTHFFRSAAVRCWPRAWSSASANVSGSSCRSTASTKRRP